MRQWQQVVRRHGPAVFATAWHVLGDAPETETVVQAVFQKAHAVGASRTEDWEPLLRRLAVRLALAHLRQRRSVPADRLRAALRELPEGEAAAFALRHFEDLSHEQIAETLQLGWAAVGATLRRGRAQLEAILTHPPVAHVAPIPG